MRKLGANLQNSWHLLRDKNSCREKFKNLLPDPNGNEKCVNYLNLDYKFRLNNAIELSNAFK